MTREDLTRFQTITQARRVSRDIFYMFELQHRSMMALIDIFNYMTCKGSDHGNFKDIIKHAYHMGHGARLFWGCLLDLERLEMIAKLMYNGIKDRETIVITPYGYKVLEYYNEALSHAIEGRYRVKDKAEEINFLGWQDHISKTKSGLSYIEPRTRKKKK
jgi:hypothetical protein